MNMSSVASVFGWPPGPTAVISSGPRWTVPAILEGQLRVNGGQTSTREPGPFQIGDRRCRCRRSRTPAMLVRATALRIARSFASIRARTASYLVDFGGRSSIRRSKSRAWPAERRRVMSEDRMRAARELAQRKNIDAVAGAGLRVFWRRRSRSGGRPAICHARLFAKDARVLKLGISAKKLTTKATTSFAKWRPRRQEGGALAAALEVSTKDRGQVHRVVIATRSSVEHDRVAQEQLGQDAQRVELR
jgi:hypothetical protein